MAIIEVDPQPGLPRSPAGVTPPDPLNPSLGETISAAFGQDNTVVNLYRRLREEQFPPEPDHNPLDLIRGTDYEAMHLDNFVASRSSGETRAIMRRIDEENEDRKVLAASGVSGFVAQVASGAADPTLALPGVVGVKLAKGGYSVARTALATAGATAAQTAAQEAVLQNTQETRTAGESAVSIASATLIGGLIGSGAAALLSRAERNALEKALDADRLAIDAHAANISPEKPALVVARRMPDGTVRYGKPGDVHVDLMTAKEVNADGPTPPDIEQGMGFALPGGRFMSRAEALEFASRFEPHRAAFSREQAQHGLEAGSYNEAMRPSGLATSAGAAATDTRQLELFKTPLDALGLDNLSVTRRTMNAASTQARREMADLSEMPYRFRENEAGVATTQGPAVDRLARMEINGQRAVIGAELDRLFSEYRFGQDDMSVPRLRARIEDFSGSGEGKMPYADFKREVAIAVQQGDQHAIPQVAAAAQFIRQRVFEPWAGRAEKAVEGFQKLEPAQGESYFPHVWNKEIIKAKRPEFTNRLVDLYKADQDTKRGAQERLSGLLRDLENTQERIDRAVKNEQPQVLETLQPELDRIREKIEAEVGAWEGKSAQEAKTALKAREKYAAESNRRSDAPRLEGADRAINRVVKRILESDRELSIDELRARAQETVDRILGSPDGRLPYDMHMGGPRIGATDGSPPRGALAERALNVSNAWARDFIENDIEQVVAMHLRTMVPDVLLSERFGDVEMTQSFRRVNESYAQLIDQTKNAKERTRLGKERDAVIRDLAAVRDRVRGVYGWSPELQNMARVANAAKAVNNLSSMGVAALSSLPDLAGSVFRYGLTSTFRDGWSPFFRNLVGATDEWKKFKSQMRAIGIGIETAINARQHALDDVADVYRPQSRVERVLQGASDKFFIANLLAPLTDAEKLIASHVAVSEILRATKAVAAGKATKKQLGNLAESGIDQHMAGRIWAQFQTGGESRGGVHLPNTGDWTDKAAAEALNGAVARDVDIMVVTPGQEKPLWMSKPVVSLLGQFKSFTASATERILVANMQRRDAAALSGIIFSLGLGMLSYKLNSFFGGMKTSDRPQDWVKEGVSRAGLLGWFEDGNALATKATRGSADVYRLIGADKPLSRFASRSAADMLLGPTWGKIESLPKITGAMASGEWSAADTSAVRRLLPFQNMFWLRGALNQVEAGTNSAFGVPERKPAN